MHGYQYPKLCSNVLASEAMSEAISCVFDNIKIATRTIVRSQ